MNRICTAAVVLTAVLGTTTFTLALPSQYHDPAAWLTAINGSGNQTIFHFDGPTETNGRAVNDPAVNPSYSSQGVTFLPFSGSNVFPYIARGQAYQIPDPARDGLLANNNSPNPNSDLIGRAIRFDFALATNAVGVYTNKFADGDGGYLEAFDAANVSLGQVDLQPGIFGGLITSAPIKHVNIVNTFNADISFGIYDLQFSKTVVPEPAAITSFALVCTAAARRRRL